MKRWMVVAVITLAVTGCSESPQQRATRISQECEAVAEEVGRIKPLSDSAKRNMVAISTENKSERAGNWYLAKA